MDVHKSTSVVVVATLCGMGAFTGCIVPWPENFSGFDEFEFTRQVVFCPLDERVRSASIQRTESDRYELELSVLEEGTEGIDDCDPNFAEPNFAGSDCFVVRDLPARELTGEEAEQMQALFQAVTIETVFVFLFCVEPCEIRWARWDCVRLPDHKSCLGFVPYRVVSYEQMDEIIAFLESLAPEADQ